MAGKMKKKTKIQHPQTCHRHSHFATQAGYIHKSSHNRNYFFGKKTLSIKNKRKLLW